MARGPGGLPSATPGWRPRVPAWAGYGACAWALLFAGVHFYWALGGTAGVETIGPAVTDLAGDPWFVAIGLWGVGAVLLILAVLMVAIVRSWHLPGPGWMRLLAVGGAGALFALYGGALLVQHGLMAAGVIAVPEGLGERALRWHLGLWDPWWLLGGVLFSLAAWCAHRSARDRRAMVG